MMREHLESDRDGSWQRGIGKQHLPACIHSYHIPSFSWRLFRSKEISERSPAHSISTAHHWKPLSNHRSPKTGISHIFECVPTSHPKTHLKLHTITRFSFEFNQGRVIQLEQRQIAVLNTHPSSSGSIPAPFLRPLYHTNKCDMYLFPHTNNFLLCPLKTQQRLRQIRLERRQQWSPQTTHCLIFSSSFVCVSTRTTAACRGQHDTFVLFDYIFILIFF